MRQNVSCFIFYLKIIFLKIFSEEVFNVVEIVFIIHLSIFDVAPFYGIEVFIEEYVGIGCFHVLSCKVLVTF